LIAKSSLAIIPVATKNFNGAGFQWPVPLFSLNRGNRREAVFHKPGDYDAFVEAIIDARARLPVDLLGYCLMPNHFHLLLRPHHDGDLGRWMQWLLTTHAQRYHRHYGITGHVRQERFKAFLVQDDDHLVTVLRYVERNALRAELVSRAEDWKWSSLPGWRRDDPMLCKGKGPVRDERWLERVNEPLSWGDLQRLRHSVSLVRPYGQDVWTRETAIRLGLESCLRPQRRPRKENVQKRYVPHFPVFPVSLRVTDGVYFDQLTRTWFWEIDQFSRSSSMTEILATSADVSRN
jgi:putative transposase